MNRKMNPMTLATLSRLAQKHKGKAKGGTKRPKGAAKSKVNISPRPGKSAQRTLAHEGRTAITRIRTTELEQFLTTPALKDAEVSQQLLAEIKMTGLEELDVNALQQIVLRVDPRALKVLGEVIDGLKACPEAEESGVSVKDMSTDIDRRHGLKGMDETLQWTQDTIQTGKQVLETWQVGAQGAVAAEFLLALATAKTEEEFLALVRDGVEVLQLEEAALQLQIDTLHQTKQTGQGLDEQVAALEDQVLFLQTMQDLRDNKRPPAAVLERMASYYAARYQDQAAGPAAPVAPAARGRKRQRAME